MMFWLEELVKQGWIWARSLRGADRPTWFQEPQPGRNGN